MKSRMACEQFQKQLGSEKSFVFDASKEETSKANSVLTKVKTTLTNPHYVILTTCEFSIGITFFQKAFVIMTEEPSTYTDYAQILARSDRTDPDAVKYGALLTSKDVLDQVNFEEELQHKEKGCRLITRDYK